MCKITPRDITETIKFFKDSPCRSLKQTITDVQNQDHAMYKKYEQCRPRLYTAYLIADANLNGMQMTLINHKKEVADIKAAKKELHDEWRLHDFQIVALQRPGTKPPFYVDDKKAA